MWIGIKPGKGGLFVAALIHELLKAGKVDVDYLVRYTNVAWLVIQDEGADDDGLFARDGDGNPLAFDRIAGGLTNAIRLDLKPALTGEFQLADGRKAVPVFQLMAARFLRLIAPAFMRSQLARMDPVPDEIVERARARAEKGKRMGDLSEG